MSSEKEITGLLVSQVGYSSSASKRLVYRGQAKTLSEAARFEVRTDSKTLFEGALRSWGDCWGSCWWVGDFSNLKEIGDFEVAVWDGDKPVESASIRIDEDQLFQGTWEQVSVDQAERRQWMVRSESKLGWFDAGMYWQEANSHACYLFGLCDLLELRGEGLPAKELQRLENQIVNGCEYLAELQDMAKEKGLGDGALVHQWFRFADQVVEMDVGKAAAAWARSANVLSDRYAKKCDDYRERARRGLKWLESPTPAPIRIYNGFPYGLDTDEFPSESTATPDLLMLLEAELSLGKGSVSDPTVSLADELCRRQISEKDAVDGFYGMFRQFESGELTMKAWTHGILDGNRLPTDLGNSIGLYLFPLIRMVRMDTEHPSRSNWLDALVAFAYGYFLPACRLNPFLLCPIGHYPKEGVLSFAGLWHGCNVVYGTAAALAYEFARLFEDDSFLEVAEGNLQWIAGLNAGLTQEALRSCFIYNSDVPEGKTVPVSMIHMVGKRTAGNWLNVRGSICNGFGVGEQFKWDVPPIKSEDGPHRLTDEDWITHSGGWLMGISRSLIR